MLRYWEQYWSEGRFWAVLEVREVLTWRKVLGGLGGITFEPKTSILCLISAGFPLKPESTTKNKRFNLIFKKLNYFQLRQAGRWKFDTGVTVVPTMTALLSMNMLKMFFNYNDLTLLAYSKLTQHILSTSMSIRDERDIYYKLTVLNLPPCKLEVCHH